MRHVKADNLTVYCPHCGAQPRQPCHNPSGNAMWTGSCPSRRKKAAQLEAEFRKNPRTPFSFDSTPPTRLQG